MKFLKKNILLIIMILIILFLCILKQDLVRNLPILANAGAVEDDELMVAHGLNILKGNWLGSYKYNTLIKNVFFPIFLAISKLVGVSYINSITILYSVACIYLIFCIKKNVSNKLFLILTFALLLFNPITYSEEVLQRVYRNSLIPGFSLMIIGSYIGMFLCREDKIVKNIIFAIVVSIVLPCFYYTREDSIWIVPYIIFMSLAIIIGLTIKFLKEKQYNKKRIICFISKILLLILPIITTSILGNYISKQNLKYYNTKTICTQKNISKLMNAFYSVKPNEEVLMASNTKEKLERIAKVSPSFNSIKPELDKLIVYFENKKTGEVDNGLFSWPLITAIYNSGYNTYEKEEEIINKIVLEINDAIEKGLLEKQEIMPILGGKALDSEGYKNWFIAIIDSIKFIGDYNNVKMANPCISFYYPGLEPYMNEFKEITGNRVIFEQGSENQKGELVIELKDQEQYINSIKQNFEILNNIKSVYRNIAIIIEIAGIIAYVYITIYVFINIIKRNYKMLNEWIIMSGIVGAILTLIIGVAYVEITQTKAIVYLYLAGAFPLFILFSLVSIYNISKIILNYVKDRKNRTI